MDFIHYRTIKINKRYNDNDLKLEVSTLFRKGNLNPAVVSKQE